MKEFMCGIVYVFGLAIIYPYMQGMNVYQKDFGTMTFILACCPMVCYILEKWSIHDPIQQKQDLSKEK